MQRRSPQRCIPVVGGTAITLPPPRPSRLPPPPLWLSSSPQIPPTSQSLSASTLSAPQISPQEQVRGGALHAVVRHRLPHHRRTITLPPLATPLLLLPRRRHRWRQWRWRPEAARSTPDAAVGLPRRVHLRGSGTDRAVRTAPGSTGAVTRRRRRAWRGEGSRLGVGSCIPGSIRRGMPTGESSAGHSDGRGVWVQVSREGGEEKRKGCYSLHPSTPNRACPCR